MASEPTPPAAESAMDITSWAQSERPIQTARSAERAGLGLMAGAAATGVLWAGTAVIVVAAVAPGGLDGLTTLQSAALFLGALAPACVIALAGVAARETARARAHARRLADAADRMMNPSPVAEAAARRLGFSVRGEVAALDRALSAAQSRLQMMDETIQRQKEAVETAAATAQSGADHFIRGLDHERATLAALSEDLSNKAAAIAEIIAAQSNAISVAARQAEGDLRKVDNMLEARAVSFGAAAAAITDRTSQMDKAAGSAASATEALEGAIVQALEALAQATKLTDAARASVEAATMAANNTAGAVRETTARAVDDARRAADVVRSEAGYIEREADAALTRLRQTAEAAREAAEEARAAAAAIVLVPPPPPPAPPRGFGHPPQPQRQPPPFVDAGPNLPAQSRIERDAPPPPRMGRPVPGRDPREAQRRGGFLGGREERPREPERRGAWTWRDLFGGGHPPERAPRPQPRPEPALAFDQAPGRGPAPAAAPMPAVRYLDLITQAGVQLEQAFTITALDRIASRARNGENARRRAVRDSAPEALRQIATAMAADPHARAAAAEFLQTDGRRIAELLDRGRASLSADATRAFLLLDAALF